MSEQAQSVQVRQCRSCGAAVTWQRTKNDKLAPFDVIADAQGALIVADNHFATCPDRDQWRKKKVPNE